MRRFLGALAAIVVSIQTFAAPLDHGDLVRLTTRDGVTQSIFIESPAPNPDWVVVLFPGTPGALHLDATGATTLRGNFLVRSASHWLEAGDAVVLVDTPSDKADGVDDLFRLSSESFADSKAVVANVRQRFPNAKIALVGTSAGTVSVGNAAQRDPSLADAYVLTSPVTVSRRGGGTLASLDVDGTKYRGLVVSNQHDECASSPPYAAKQLADHNHFDFVSMDSGEGSGDKTTECQGHSPHGFLGIERQVLGGIQDWLLRKSEVAK
ncbi:Alpha/beta hydrolase [Pararobbsia alpina]|uniref:alpha/beta hydrolase n=1 Tax=Pararobbsia alpina TaxID=621374 RepID=UPI0039A50AC6